MATKKSCIKGFGSKSPFSLNPERISYNMFIELGISGAGRTHVVLIFKDTLDWGSLYVDTSSKFVYSQEITHYYIKSIEGYVIGSLFDVGKRHTDISYLKLTVQDRLEESNSYTCTNELGHGGVTVYSDSEDSFLIVPNDIPKKSYVVAVD